MHVLVERRGRLSLAGSEFLHMTCPGRRTIRRRQVVQRMTRPDLIMVVREYHDQ
jgi:hypothetical protein